MEMQLGYKLSLCVLHVPDEVDLIYFGKDNYLDNACLGPLTQSMAALSVQVGSWWAGGLSVDLML